MCVCVCVCVREREMVVLGISLECKRKPFCSQGLSVQEEAHPSVLPVLVLRLLTHSLERLVYVHVVFPLLQPLFTSDRWPQSRAASSQPPGRPCRQVTGSLPTHRSASPCPHYIALPTHFPPAYTISPCPHSAEPPYCSILLPPLPPSTQSPAHTLLDPHTAHSPAPI